jgi:steroid delta-isomerase-like uncharacterized protein
MTSCRKRALTDFLRVVWTLGDAEAADRFLAARYTIHHDPGDPWEGRTLDLEGFKDRVRRSRAPFPDQAFDVQALVEEADRVVAAWLWTATHLGDFPGYPASGKPLRMSGITVYDFAGDRLCGHWQVVDRLSILAQLGAPVAGD